jgi:glycolate oxidase FAD binding subunit
VDGCLWLRLAGAEPALRAARLQLGGAEVGASQAAGFWGALREQQLPWFSGGLALWRIAVPSTAAVLDLPGAALVEWGGGLRWLRSDLPATAIRAQAQALGGHATLFRGGDRSQPVFTPLSPALLAIHRRLKAEFDPAGIFNRGRLVPDL